MNTTLATSAAIFITSFAVSAADAPLTLNVYNPGSQSTFAVTSTLISGAKDAILVDAQFQKNDAEKLVDMIKASGKTLTTIFISQSDPDYYFGLDTVLKSFPNVKVISTPQTAYLIDITKDEKLAIWKDQLKDNAPKSLTTPIATTTMTLDLEGNKIEIKQDPKAPEHSYLWIPSIQAIVGGVDVVDGMHVWLADSQSDTSRDQWIARLKDMKALSPKTIVPGHFLNHKEGTPFTIDSVDFTQHYIETFNKFKRESKDAASLIQKMKTAYPNLAGEGTLEMGAKVIMGDMPWKTVHPFPALGKKVTVSYDDISFDLHFIDNKTMSFIGTKGKFKGTKETVNYTATEVAPDVYMIAWHEPKSGSNVVHLDDFKQKITYTNIAAKDGSLTQMKGTLSVSDKN